MPVAHSFRLIRRTPQVGLVVSRPWIEVRHTVLDVICGSITVLTAGRGSVTAWWLRSPHVGHGCRTLNVRAACGVGARRSTEVSSEVSTVSCSSVGGNSGRRGRDTPTLGRGSPWLGRRTPRSCVDGEPGYPSLCCIAPVWKASRVWPEPLAAEVGDSANEALEHVGITGRIWPGGNSRPLMLDGRATSLLVTWPRRFSGKRTEPIGQGRPWT